MNTDHLSRCYDQLTPAERLPLIIAAGARGDAVEQERLSASAPTQRFEVPDYYAHGRAWNEAANYHLLTLLDLGMHFWQWWGLWMTHGVRDQAAAGPNQGRRGKARAEKAQAIRTGGLVRYYAARFVAHVDGWKQFCADSHVDPEVQLRFMIGWDNVVRTESKARELAFSPDEALWFVRMETVPVEGDDTMERGPIPVESASELADGWHVILAQLVHQEGGV